MQELQDKILGIIRENGGSVPYSEVYEQLDFKERSMLRNVMTSAKANGVFIAQVSFDADTRTTSHNFVEVGA